MVVQTNDTKTKQSLLDLLGGNSAKTAKGTNDMFAKLLASIKTDPKQAQKVDIKLQNSSELVKEAKPSKFKDDLLKLLGKESSDLPLISKDISQNLTPTQLKMVFNEAKEFIKKEIVAKKPELANEIKEMPKTLESLISLAKKLDLNLSKITLADVTQSLPKDDSLPQSMLTKPMFDIKAIALVETKTYEKGSESSQDMLSRLLKKPQEESVIATPKEATDTKSEPLKDILQQKESKSEPLKDLLQQTTTKIEQKTSALEGVVDKVSDEQPKTPMSAKSELLQTLLMGESKDDGESRSDRSISEPKNIVPSKIDSIEVKSAEAKQSMRVFASELKEAIQDYKPPFTRIAMKLNPERLGQVDVTLIQRGNTIHVNIQSPNINSVAFLAHNATELRAQLAQQGITNTTMNFMSGGGDQNQPHQQQQQKAFKSYKSLEELELDDEQLTALEITVPYYA